MVCILSCTELGRGTSFSDGMVSLLSFQGICVAICEKLVKSGAFIFFATHFQQLCDALSSYPDIVDLHLSLSPTNAFAYTVQAGAVKTDHYGIKLAEIAGFPGGSIVRAKQVAELMAAKYERIKQSNAPGKEEQRGIERVRIVKLLRQVKECSRLERDDLIEYVKGLQADFKSKMD